jgi:Xaa-Pro aminopeptidase
MINWFNTKVIIYLLMRIFASLKKRNNMNPILDRLSALRQAMQQQNISAYIIPGTDPHANEYIADHWKEREWITGFDGSAGTVVITSRSAFLWTDSRYFLQAEEQLQMTGVRLMKQGLPETLDIPSWINLNFESNDKIGINPAFFSHNSYKILERELDKKEIELVSIDLIDTLWNDRPTLPLAPFDIYDTKFTGKSAVEKLELLRIELKKEACDKMIISALDEIAWLFNIRSNDIAFNPIVISYAIIENECAKFFVAPEKLNPTIRIYFQELGIEIIDYRLIHEEIKNSAIPTTFWIDGEKINQALFHSIPTQCKILNKTSPITKLKSIKNETERDGLRLAMRKDGVALTRFFIWLEQNLEKGGLSEISISEQLLLLRGEQEHFICESFGTIAGYAEHGAIVHYSATPSTNSTLKAENILLLDSGGQYLDGTTDITRTVALGKVSDQQKQDFTLVLKGHIAVANAIFPAGTTGSQLDILARQALWKEGLNYGHGTGHGVGHFLCVHEGPQSIRPDQNPTALEIGMLLSNEPGMYRTNEYGIRIENLVQVVPAKSTAFGDFLQFETVTLFPIDRKLIDICLLTREETEWVDVYHQKVFDKLAPHLDNYEKEWLEDKCRSIYDLIF